MNAQSVWTAQYVQMADGKSSGVISGAISWLKEQVTEPLRRRSAYQETVDQLGALDDRLLRDIGLHRGQIPFAVEAPMAQAVTAKTGRTAAQHLPAVQAA